MLCLVVARTEDLLVSAARAGDRTAIEQLLVLYQPDVRRFARRMCKTSEDADDAVQHTLVQLSTQVSTFRQIARLTSWLFTIVKHECSRLIARALRRTADDTDVALDNALGSRPDLELALALREAFGRLDPDLREVVLL
jgi:RNA polymerase sigma factor (sigma-70 family)